MTSNKHALAALINSLVLNQLNDQAPSVRWERGTRRNEGMIGLHLNYLPTEWEAERIANEAADKGFDVVFVH